MHVVDTLMMVRLKLDGLDFNEDFEFLKTKIRRLNSGPFDFDPNDQRHTHRANVGITNNH